MYTKSIVDSLVRNAIQDMLESHVEMMADAPELGHIGDITETMREVTLDYVEDMMADLKFEVIKEIKEIKFTAKIEATLKFDE